MKFENTSFKLACIMDTMKGVDKKKAAYLAKMNELLSPDYLRTYSAEHQEAERMSLNKSYLSAMVKDVESVEKNCDDLKAAFEKDVSAKADATEALNTCFGYISMTQGNFDPDYIEIIAKPLRASCDIRSMRAIYNACKNMAEDGAKLPFNDVMTECHAMDELKRKLELLCNKAKEQLPSKSVDVDTLAAASAVLDMWGVANLINYAGEIKAGIDGEEYSPAAGGAFNFNFKPVK